MTLDKIREEIEKKIDYIEKNHLTLGAKLRIYSEVRRLISELDDREERIRYKTRLDDLAMQTC